MALRVGVGFVLNDRDADAERLRGVTSLGLGLVSSNGFLVTFLALAGGLLAVASSASERTNDVLHRGARLCVRRQERAKLNMVGRKCR